MSILNRCSIKGIIKIYFKHVQCQTCANRTLHQFRCTIPWKNTVELSEYLIESVVHNDNGLLVLNKPYGISFSRDGGSDPTRKEEAPKVSPEDRVFKKQTERRKINKYNPYHSSGVVNDSLNLVDCLPYLKKHFGFENLYLSRVPEKYLSGVAILTTTKELVERVNKCREHLPTGKDRYVAVVVGTPRHPEGKVKLGFIKEEHKQFGKRVVLLQKWSNNAYERGEVRIGTFHFRTKSEGFDNLTSLIEICVELRKYHAPRLFAADFLLSPVLGDNMYGSRVQTVMGVPMSVHHFNEVTTLPQKLPDEVYHLLGLSAGDASLIPVHLHLAEMLLPRFLPGKQPLVLTAPPPAHFQWTCNKLGLDQPMKAALSAT